MEAEPVTGPLPGPKTREILWDCAFLSALVVLSLALYIRGLGFYSDDWSFLGHLSMSQDQSVTGLYRTMIEFPHKGGRPLQALSEALLFRAFGANPLGYHLVNSTAFLAGILAFYLALRELGVHSASSLSIPAVYAVLPNFSTTRLWMAAFQANTTLALVFLSFYADLRAVRSRPTAFWAWKLVALSSLIVGALGYEAFIPLLLLGPVLVWQRARAVASRSPGEDFRLSRVMLPLAVNLAVVVGAALYKLATYDRLQLEAKKSLYEHVYLTGWLAEHAVRTHFIDWGARLPAVVGKILTAYRNPEMLLVGALTGIMVLAYLTVAAGRARAGLPSARYFVLMTAAGIGAFVLGYAAFFGNYQLTFTPTGIGNRTAAAGAVGVAVVWTGVAGIAASLVPGRRARAAAYGLLISALCASGFLATNAIASFWVTANYRVREVLADIDRRFPDRAPWKTLLLDGVCPYEGPAIVFESSWDLEGALLLRYRDYTLKADVVSPRLEVREDGIYTSIYRFHKRYAYEGLYVYNPARKLLIALTDAAGARRYFERVSPDMGLSCPPGEPGHGVRVF